MDVSKFTLSEGVHRNQNIIWIRFGKDTDLIKALRKDIMVKWSNSNKSWYAVDTKHNREKLGLEVKLIGKEVLSKISDKNRLELERMENELKLKAYSPNTMRTYLIEFAQLLYILKGFSVLNLSSEQLKSYLLYCINHDKISENHLHSRMNAIKFYFEKVLKRERFLFDIPRPKKPQLLPKVISKVDVKKMLSKIENPKHLLIIKLCYGMGLRVSEIVNIELSDIDRNRMQVHIRHAKGKKDRYVPLPETTLVDFITYYHQYKPVKYLFEGQTGGQYSVRSVQAVFKSAMKKANINKKVGIHGLRHSYATHLLESGIDISLIKELLGHNDIKTTLIYTHVSQKNLAEVKSPLDNL